MPLRDCRHWIFDMDGTLTLPVHDFNAIRQQIGIAENTPILEAIALMPKAEAEKISLQLHELEMELAYEARPQPGIANLLDGLRGNGCQLGILTRNDEDIAEATLKACGLDIFFDTEFVIGRETCAPKPLPDGVFHLLDIWGANPDKTVMVGDFRYDIEAGKKAGVRTVHFDSDGLFSWPEFMDHGVSQVADIRLLIGG